LLNKFQSDNLKGRHHLGNLDVHGIITTRKK